MRRRKKRHQERKSSVVFCFAVCCFSGKMWQEIRVKRREGWNGIENEGKEE